MSIAAIEYRLATLNSLLGVVEALRSLTAAKQQKAASLLPAAETYADATAQGLRLLDPETSAPRLTAPLVLGPEGGFTGGLCGRLAAAVPEGWTPDVAGRRTAAALRVRGLPTMEALAAPVTADALPALASRLADRMPPDAVIAVLHPQGHGIMRTDLPPLARSSGRHDLLTQLPGDRLVAAAALQDRQARLLKLLLLTHIAEQMARLATLTGARERIRDRLSELSIQLSTARQDGISQEIADLWAGRRAAIH